MTILAFGLALLADIATTQVALSRGLREGNPLLSVSSPWVVMIALSALVVAPAEICRALGLSPWTDAIYLGGSVPHAIAAIVNAVMIWRAR